MKKSRIEKLIPIANEVLTEQYTREQRGGREREEKNSILQKKGERQFYIKSNYDGKVSGFGIAVALSGLRPALAMYFNESSEVKTRPILEAIAKIIVEDGEYGCLPENEATAEGLLRHALSVQGGELDRMKKYVLEASIALKQIVRTYELV